MSLAETVAFALLLAIFAYLAHRFYTIGYASWDAEALYWHAGTVGWMSRGTFPPTGVLEPDTPLHYRFGIYALPAALVAITNASPPVALAAALAQFVPMMVLAFVGASIRFSSGPRPGLFAAFLALFGGSLLPPFLLATHGLDASSSGYRPQAFVSGLVWLGNNLDMLHNNVTITAGFVAFSSALWLTWEAVAGPKFERAGLALATGSLAFLGLTNEVHFVALLCGLFMAVAAQALQQRGQRSYSLRRHVVSMSIVVVVAAGLVFVRGGILGGAAIGGSGQGSVKLVLNTEHFGSVPSAPGIWDPRFIPFLSADVQLDTNFAFLLVPLLLLLAWRTRNTFAIAGLGAAIAALVAWLTVYPASTVWDGFRFAQAGLLMYLCMLPFLYGSARSHYPALNTTAANTIAALLLVTLTAIHAFLAFSVAVSPLASSQAVQSTPDYAAAQFLRSSRDTSRVLIPVLETDYSNLLEIYRSDELGVALRTVSGVSAHAIPIGHNGYDYRDRYIAPYRRASLSFSADDLASLRIDWVYVLPQRLSLEQQASLDNARSSHRLVLVRTFGKPGTPAERQLYRVTQG